MMTPRAFASPLLASGLAAIGACGTASSDNIGIFVEATGPAGATAVVSFGPTGVPIDACTVSAGGPSCSRFFSDANATGTVRALASPAAGTRFVRWGGECADPTAAECEVPFATDDRTVSIEVVLDADGPLPDAGPVDMGGGDDGVGGCTGEPVQVIADGGDMDPAHWELLVLALVPDDGASALVVEQISEGGNTFRRMTHDIAPRLAEEDDPSRVNGHHRYVGPDGMPGSPGAPGTPGPSARHDLAEGAIGCIEASWRRRSTTGIAVGEALILRLDDRSFVFSLPGGDRNVLSTEWERRAYVLRPEDFDNGGGGDPPDLSASTGVVSFAVVRSNARTAVGPDGIATVHDLDDFRVALFGPQ